MVKTIPLTVLSTNRNYHLWNAEDPVFLTGGSSLENDIYSSANYRCFGIYHSEDTPATGTIVDAGSPTGYHQPENGDEIHVDVGGRSRAGIGDTYPTMNGIFTWDDLITDHILIDVGSPN